MKQFICILLLVFVLVQSASATEIADTAPETIEAAAVVTESATLPEEPVRSPDQCGEDTYWRLSGGTLTIFGTGGTDDFSAGTPWAEHRDFITTVVIESGVTYLGSSAFENYDSLLRVEFGDTFREAGTKAFRSCDALTEVSLPASFRVLGEESFMSCAALKTMNFAGGMPSFRLNCLWDTYAKLIFPAQNPWPLEHISQLETSFQGRIEFLASDGTDPYVAEGEETEPSTEPTVETTEATTEATTEPATVPTTVPTEAVTVPTEVQTQPTWTTQQTEPEKPERSTGGGVGLAVTLCIVSVVLLGILLVGKLRSGGKYSR